MASQSFSVSAAPVIEVSTDGNLRVSGWSQESVEVQNRSEDALSAEFQDDRLRLYCEEDLVLKVPTQCRLQINVVEGSLTISSVFGEINVQSVGGSVTLQACGTVSCVNISGHCKFTSATGDLRLLNIGGNLKGSSSSGKLIVSNVGGNIKLLDVLLVDKVHAGGNIKAKLPASPLELEALAGGNIKLWIPQDANFNLEAHSGGEKVVFQSGTEQQRFVTGRHNVAIGAGGPLVRLHAGGNVYILNSGWEEDLVAEDFIPLEESAPDWTSDNFNNRINRKIEEKMRQAEAKAQAAGRRAEAQMRRLDRFRIPPIPPIPPIPNVGDFWPKSTSGSGAAGGSQPQPEPRPKVSDEERMIILNLLSEKKISADEANQLLDALNGKFNK